MVRLYEDSRTPFVHSFKMTRLELAQFCLVSIFLVPLRLISILLMTSVIYILCVISIYRHDPETALSGWRRKLKNIGARLLIWMHYSMGFKVTTKGHRAPASMAPIIVMAPHSTFFDTLAHCSIGTPSVVAKKSLFDVPVVGLLMKVTLPIIVDRFDKESRRITVEKIRDRGQKALNASDVDEWPQVAIFAEGTCTNRTRLISFKQGAFHPLLPVQPVCLKWKQSGYDSLTWTYEGPNPLYQLLITLGKFRHVLEIEYLPVYVPSEAEKSDVSLFARNVRDVMANALKMETTEYTLDDAPFSSNFTRPDQEYIAKLCEHVLPHLKGDSGAEELSADFRKLEHPAVRQNFYVAKFEDFLMFNKLPVCDSSRRLFNVFDWKCHDLIDLREFVLGKHYDNFDDDEERLELALKLFASETTSPIVVDNAKQGNGVTSAEPDRTTMSEETFTKIVRIPFALSLSQCSKLHAQTKPLLLNAQPAKYRDILLKALTNHHYRSSSKKGESVAAADHRRKQSATNKSTKEENVRLLDTFRTKVRGGFAVVRTHRREKSF